MSSENSRAQRFRVCLAPAILDRFVQERAAWHESPGEVRARLRRAERSEALMAWVVAAMPRVLTVRERVCIDLYYFRGMNYREIGEATGTNKSSAFRGVARGLRKLREEKERDCSWESALRALEPPRR